MFRILHRAFLPEAEHPLLQKYDQNKIVLINSYYIDEDYDWDENLELKYIDEVISPEINETENYVYLN